MRIQLMVMIAAATLLTACNSNPGWDGNKSTAKADVLAEEACKCVYETMDADAEFDVDKIVSNLDEFKKHQASGGEGSIADKWPDIATAMIKMQELTDKIDGSPCMSEVDDKALSQGVPIEDMFDALDKHCSLAMFYN